LLVSVFFLFSFQVCFFKATFTFLYRFKASAFLGHSVVTPWMTHVIIEAVGGKDFAHFLADVLEQKLANILPICTFFAAV